LGADKVFFHGDLLPDLGSYGTEFYFQQQLIKQTPSCRVLPTDAADVATVVKICRDTGCPFAVKSGGHGEGSNIESGVTIDLSLLKDVCLSDDRKTVVVGSGCRWGEIYGKLDADGLAIVGGRASSVGVGGLTLGGMRTFA
jgi:FAD/FMN-containing dehydrogenase